MSFVELLGERLLDGKRRDTKFADLFMSPRLVREEVRTDLQQPRER